MMMQQAPLSKTDLIRYFQEYMIKIIEIILQARVLPNNRTPRHNVSFNLHFPERLLTPREEIQSKHGDFFTGSRSFVVELYKSRKSGDTSSDGGTEGETADSADIVQEVWIFHYEPAGPDAPRGQLVERKNQILVKKLSTTLRAAMTFVRVLPVPSGNVSSALSGQHPEYRMRVVEGQHKAQSHLKNLEFSTLVCSAGALKVSVAYLPKTSAPSSPDQSKRISQGVSHGTGNLASTPEEPARFTMDEGYLSSALEHQHFAAMRRSVGASSSTGHQSPILEASGGPIHASASRGSLPFCPSPRGNSVGGNSAILTPSGMLSPVAGAASPRLAAPILPPHRRSIDGNAESGGGLGNIFGTSSVHMGSGIGATGTSAGAFAMGHSTGSGNFSKSESNQQLADLEQRSSLSSMRQKNDLGDVWGASSIHSDDGMWGSGSGASSKKMRETGDAGAGELCLLGMSDDEQDQSGSAGSAAGGRSPSPDDSEPLERIVQSTILSGDGGGAFVCDRSSANKWLESDNEFGGGTDVLKSPQTITSSPAFGSSQKF